jgi:5'-AMP-activated protein kinase catalytic alpha subunit
VIGKKIGQGTFNKVMIAKHSITNEQVAIKIIEKSKIENEADRNRLNKELKILRKARHPNIAQLF